MRKGARDVMAFARFFALLKVAAKKKVSDFVKGTAKERRGALSVRRESCRGSIC